MRTHDLVAMREVGAWLQRRGPFGRRGSAVSKTPNATVGPTPDADHGSGRYPSRSEREQVASGMRKLFSAAADLTYKTKSGRSPD